MTATLADFDPDRSWRDALKTAKDARGALHAARQRGDWEMARVAKAALVAAADQLAAAKRDLGW